jgi:hypothetical protein
MSTTTSPVRKRGTRWIVPGIALAIGVGYLVAGIVGDDLGFGIFGLALMAAAAAAALVLARYSETMAALLDRSDERINGIDLAATAFAGVVAICADLVMFIVEIARGEDGSPYYQLGAIAGLAYLAALIYLRVRR